MRNLLLLSLFFTSIALANEENKSQLAVHFAGDSTEAQIMHTQKALEEAFEKTLKAENCIVMETAKINYEEIQAKRKLPYKIFHKISLKADVSCPTMRSAILLVGVKGMIDDMIHYQIAKAEYIHSDADELIVSNRKNIALDFKLALFPNSNKNKKRLDERVKNFSAKVKEAQEKANAEAGAKLVDE